MADTIKEPEVDLEQARRDELTRRRLLELTGRDEAPCGRRPWTKRRCSTPSGACRLPTPRVGVMHRPTSGVDYREISTRDWERAGVSPEQNPGYVRWDAGNDWSVPRGMLDFLSEGQFNQFILGDGQFQVGRAVKDIRCPGKLAGRLGEFLGMVAWEIKCSSRGVRSWPRHRCPSSVRCQHGGVVGYQAVRRAAKSKN
jgi:hypothetical protein